MIVVRIEPPPSLEEAAAIELAFRLLAGTERQLSSRWATVYRADLKVGCYSREELRARSSWGSVARREAIARVV
jgi:hypothetical protein